MADAVASCRCLKNSEEHLEPKDDRRGQDRFQDDHCLLIVLNSPVHKAVDPGRIILDSQMCIYPCEELIPLDRLAASGRMYVSAAQPAETCHAVSGREQECWPKERSNCQNAGLLVSSTARFGLPALG